MFKLDSLVEGIHTGKGRDGSLDVVGGDESHDSNHSKTSVVQFTGLLRLQCFGINSTEVELRENNFRCGSSLHVVSSLGFAGKFGNEDGSQDLGLSGIGDGIPGIEGLHRGEGVEGDITAEHTREVESLRLDNVSGEGKHGNTTVLQFGGTEPCEGFVTSDIGKVEGIKVLDWLGASGHGVQVGGELGAGSLLRDRSEGGCRTGKGE
mmetsp:Transcript_26563/g.56927  ORF Transcript_26563/g.56927 Transcript_26563/m.56927 type:complete len:207 (-) Transcript_26563:87-707(-)